MTLTFDPAAGLVYVLAALSTIGLWVLHQSVNELATRPRGGSPRMAAWLFLLFVGSVFWLFGGLLHPAVLRLFGVV